MTVKNKVQLITYPDSLGGDLKTLNKVLRNYFVGIFEGGVHILPPFPSSGDRGFAPLTYLEIEPTFGTWKDIRAITESFDVLLDLMVNHISKQSHWFQDFLKKGRNSEFAGLFLTPEKVWPDGKPNPEDLEKIFLRRTEPFSSFTIEDTGETETVWTTFGKQVPSEQIDLDINAQETRQLLTEFMDNFARQGVKIVRLDAVGYVIKKPGTSCFFVEPEIFEFMEWMTNLANSRGIALLPEVHAQYNIQYKLAHHGYWIYDFILPFCVLEALLTHSGQRLTNYLKDRPHNQFTMLDCHDGIPIKPDLDDLISSDDASRIVDICLERGSNLSLIFSDKHKSADGFDVHQIRCSYYSALGCADDAYLAARAIQFFTPGIPQVYYVGLLAGENDLENVERTGEGREINRHNFTLDEIEEAIQKPVVHRLMTLIRFRNHFPAFDGNFSVEPAEKTQLSMLWEKDDQYCRLNVDLENYRAVITYAHHPGETKSYKI